MKLAKLICLCLALFDLILSVCVLLFPDFFLQIFQPSALESSTVMLQRTGMLWVVFILVELWAYIKGEKMIELFLIVGAFRLMDVPADLLWLLLGKGFTWFGVLGLVIAPLFNLIAGIYLVSFYFKLKKVAH
ncbi:hypothetical protein JYU20_02175 [Bacteroidales bacterium AH-315-I05]|nr:hypothetical protein [Bacteroidales bacterium AH-315-I05]